MTDLLSYAVLGLIFVLQSPSPPKPAVPATPPAAQQPAPAPAATPVAPTSKVAADDHEP